MALIPIRASFHMEAKEMLTEHFLWNYRYKTEFSSWASSLLFVLQHAVRKSDYRCESDVCIYVLDTRILSNVSIYPATILLRVYGIEDKGRLRHEYYSGEYPIHGGIEDTTCFQVVSLPHLIHCGLFNLFPELNEERGKGLLYRRVQELRSSFFNQPSPVSAVDVQSLRQLGTCFGDEFALPVTVALLSLRLRCPRDKGVLEKVLEGFRGLIIPSEYL